MIFCVWLLAFSPQLCEQLRRYNVVPALSDILQESVKEKVTRIILAAFRVRGKHFKHYFAALDFSSLNSLCHWFDSKLLWLYMHLVESLEHIESLLFFSVVLRLKCHNDSHKYIERLQLTQKKIVNFLLIFSRVVAEDWTLIILIFTASSLRMCCFGFVEIDSARMYMMGFSSLTDVSRMSRMHIHIQSRSNGSELLFFFFSYFIPMSLWCKL